MDNIKKFLKKYNLDSDEIKKLDGYASINYKIKSNDKNYVLKHYTEKDEFNLIMAEDAIMKNLSSKALPFMVPSSVQKIKRQTDGSFTRLINFIEGNLLSETDQSDELLFNFGKAVGLLHQNLENMRSDAIEARNLFWNMQHTLLNKPKIKYIPDSSDKKIIAYFFDLFEHYILPVQAELRHSIIHSDLNDNNIVVKKNQISGFIDFGDITYAPVIYETAIAIAYIMLANKGKEFTKAAQFIKGCHSVFPIKKEEIKLLYYLIPARLCVSVCNSALLKTKNKDTEYVLVSEKPAWGLLHKWISMSPVWVTDFFFNALGFKEMEKDSNEIALKRKQYTGKSLGMSYKEPIFMTGSAFQYMFDNKGNTYLDAYNNIPHIGHCHPNISRVLSRHCRKLNTNTRYLYPELADYAEQLCKKLPGPLKKIYFVNSGSAASDLAIRMARAHTKRKSVAVLEHGYHGNTITGIEISSYKFDGKGGAGKSDLITVLPLPNLYKGKFSSTEEYVEDAVSRLENAIKTDTSPSTLIAEPISGCGGQVPLASGYLKHLKPFLEKHHILLTTDEVQTGFGRLGKYFWGFEMHEVIPDILILGKPMGNGHPVAAVVTTEEIADSFANGMEFFSSFGGNPVSCAVAAEVLKVIDEENLMKNALQTGIHLKAELNELKKQYPAIGDVRGEGLFIGIEFIDKKGRPHKEAASFIKNKMKENFILLGTDGPHGNVIKIKPPICLTIENADEILNQLQFILNSSNFPVHY